MLLLQVAGQEHETLMHMRVKVLIARPRPRALWSQQLAHTAQCTLHAVHFSNAVPRRIPGRARSSLQLTAWFCVRLDADDRQVRNACITWHAGAARAAIAAITLIGPNGPAKSTAAEARRREAFERSSRTCGEP